VGVGRPRVEVEHMLKTHAQGGIGSGDPAGPKNFGVRQSINP